MKIAYPLIAIMLLMPGYVQAAEVSQYICTIAGVYEISDGRLVQRLEKKGVGEKIYVNADTGEVTGYFGTDDWNITKFRRPEGLLTIEAAEGIRGDGANRLNITPVAESELYSFLYTKNWLYISGLCSAVIRHK
jgi:hypothetical protein